MINEKFFLLCAVVVLTVLKLIVGRTMSTSEFLSPTSFAMTIALRVYIIAAIQFALVLLIVLCTMLTDGSYEQWYAGKKRSAVIEFINGFMQIGYVTLPVVMYGFFIFVALTLSWPLFFVFIGLQLARFFLKLLATKRIDVGEQK